MKERKVSFKDDFGIKDESGIEKYRVKGELLTWGKKLHIYNDKKEEEAEIVEKIISFKPKFYIYVGNEQVAEIVKETTLFKPKYKITGLGWEIKGNVGEHKYTISKDGIDIVNVKKKRISLSNSYVIDIVDEEYSVLAIASVLAINVVLSKNK